MSHTFPPPDRPAAAEQFASSAPCERSPGLGTWQHRGKARAGRCQSSLLSSQQSPSD